MISLASLVSRPFSAISRSSMFGSMQTSHSALWCKCIHDTLPWRVVPVAKYHMVSVLRRLAALQASHQLRMVCGETELAIAQNTRPLKPAAGIAEAQKDFSRMGNFSVRVGTSYGSTSSKSLP